MPNLDQNEQKGPKKERGKSTGGWFQGGKRGQHFTKKSTWALNGHERGCVAGSTLGKKKKKNTIGNKKVFGGGDPPK